MVWLHGGGYTMGSGSNRSTITATSQNGVILVTVNMRLGTMGLLAHPLLSKESAKGISGNYHFFDMIAASNGCRETLLFSEANAKNVTIFGESGGGAQGQLFMASLWVKGFFTGAFLKAERRRIFTRQTHEDLEAMGEKFFAKLGINKETDPVKLPCDTAGENLEAEASLIKDLKSEDLWDSAIDQNLLTDLPAIYSGRQTESYACNN